MRNPKYREYATCCPFIICPNSNSRFSDICGMTLPGLPNLPPGFFSTGNFVLSKPSTALKIISREAPAKHIKNVPPGDQTTCPLKVIHTSCKQTHIAKQIINTKHANRSRSVRLSPVKSPSKLMACYSIADWLKAQFNRYPAYSKTTTIVVGEASRVAPKVSTIMKHHRNVGQHV